MDVWMVLKTHLAVAAKGQRAEGRAEVSRCPPHTLCRARQRRDSIQEEGDCARMGLACQALVPGIDADRYRQCHLCWPVVTNSKCPWKPEGRGRAWGTGGEWEAVASPVPGPPGSAVRESRLRAAGSFQRSRSLFVSPMIFLIFKYRPLIGKCGVPFMAQQKQI